MKFDFSDILEAKMIVYTTISVCFLNWNPIKISVAIHREKRKNRHPVCRKNGL